MHKNISVVLVLIVGLFGFAAQAGAALTLSSTSITGDASSTIDLGAGNTLSIQTTGNGPITVGTGLVTTGGSLTVTGSITNSALTASRLLFTDGSKVLASTGASAAVSSAVSDETGSGLLVFGTAPTFASTITVGTAAGTTGAINLKGTTSGTITLTTAAAAGTYTLTLPANDGDASQVLQTDGSGVLTWATVGGGSQTPWTSNINADGFTLYGNDGANEDLTLEGTSSATKATSYVILQPTGGNVGIGTTTPAVTFHANKPSSTASTDNTLQKLSFTNNGGSTVAGGGITDNALFIDHDISGTIGINRTQTVNGIYVDMDNSVTVTGTQIASGIRVENTYSGGTGADEQTMYGLHVTATGDLSATTGVHYGGLFVASGAASVNYAVHASAAGGGGNYAIYSSAGNNYFASNVGIGDATPDAVLDISSDLFILEIAKTPASASATCTTGSIAWDTGFIYVCTATDTWKRAAIATW